jgi:hypothetical protein
MVKCGYCKDEIKLALNGFSGLPNDKFCQSCWSKIYTVHQAQRLILKEPKLIEFAGLVTEEEDEE